MKNKVIYGLGLAAIIVITAMTASYITKESVDANAQTYGQPASMQTKTTAKNNSMPWKQAQPAAGNNNSGTPWKNQNTANTQQQPMQQQQAQPCNDNNVVGTVLGGVAGGLVGNGIGKGSGKTVATIAGTVGGAYMGNQLIPTQGVACR